MKLASIFKASLKIITIFIPKAQLVRIASGIAIWAVESLVKSTKTTLDDRGFAIIKKVIKAKKLQIPEINGYNDIQKQNAK